MKIRAFFALMLATLLCVPAIADAPLLKQAGHWAQDYTGRQADPAVVFGTLPNGMRYAILHNETPSDGVAMRMRIGSGSMKERDEEQGLAHYLEHMAFRGSTNVADGEVIKMLERHGLRFGPDTNAFTAQDQTVYMFNFPKAGEGALDTGLMLLREIGGRLDLAPATVEAERGVLLSEERLRDVPGYRAVKVNLGNSLAGTRAVQRWPIGLIETIKGATPERLRRYYEANYRPENATLIVVGNVDPAKVEAMIKERFSDWQGKGAADGLDPGQPDPAKPASEFAAAGAPDLLTLSWVRPRDARAATADYDREQMVQYVALTVLNNRIADRAAKPGSPFVGGQAALVPDLVGAASLTQLAVAAAPEKWNEALAAVILEQRQATAGPVTAEELKRAVTQVRTQLDTAAANAPTRKNEDLADGLLSAAAQDQLYTSPRQDLDFARPVLDALTPELVEAAMRQAFTGKGPVLFRSSQGEPAGADKLAAELAADYAKPLAARAADAAIVWPYSSFGAPGKVVSRKVDKQLGTTLVTFANGSRLLVRPSTLEKDKIRISVSLGGGRAGADPALLRALWAVDLMPLGGTGKLALADVQRWAQSGGLVVNAQLKAGVRSFSLTGNTRPADFASEMQLLAAYARDPGFRPELGEKMAAIGPMVSGQVDANAGAVFMRETQRLTGGGDSRFGQLPTGAEIAATTPTDLPALLGPALAGPADVTIVGDIDVAGAIKAMQTTFAAGPKLTRKAVAKPSITMPTGRDEPWVVNHKGRADQAFYGRYWALPDYFANPSLSYTADVAAAILRARLVDTVREKLGLTYSPNAGAVGSVQIAGQGYLSVSIETPEGNFTTFAGLLDEQISDLAAKPVSADELDRARRPLIESRTNQYESNEWWIGNLPQVLIDPRVRSVLLSEVTGIERVDAAQVQQLFAGYVVGKKPVTVIAKAK